MRILLISTLLLASIATSMLVAGPTAHAKSILVSKMSQSLMTSLHKNVMTTSRKLTTLAMDASGHWVYVLDNGARYYSNLAHFDKKKNFRNKLREIIQVKKQKVEAIGFTSGGNWAVVTKKGFYVSSISGFKNIGFFQKISKIKKDWGQKVQAVAFGPHNFWAVAAKGKLHMNMDARKHPEVAKSEFLKVMNHVNQHGPAVTALSVVVSKTGKLRYAVAAGERLFAYPLNDKLQEHAARMVKASDDLGRSYKRMDQVILTPGGGHLVFSQGKAIIPLHHKRLGQRLPYKYMCNSEGENCKNGRDSLLNRMRHHKVSGIQIATIKDSKVQMVLSLGYRDRKNQTHVFNTSVFSAASLSKFFSSASFLLAGINDNLKLDRSLIGSRTVGSYIKDIGGGIKNWYNGRRKSYRNNINKTYIGDLLSMTGGTNIHGVGLYKTKDVPSINDWIRSRGKTRTGKVKPINPPQKKYEYSGGGYGLSESVFNSIVGKSFANYTQENVMGPLKLYHATFKRLSSYRQSHDLSFGHNQKLERWGYRECPVDTAGGLYTNASDYAKYLIVFMENGLMGPTTTKRLLPEYAIKQILTPRYLKGGSGKVCSENKQCKEDKGETCYKKRCQKMSYYGYGVSMSQGRDSNDLPIRISHSGAQDGYRSYFKAWPSQKKGIVILTNGIKGSKVGAHKLIDEIMARYNEL
jgi:CubicO group peptidase (beta-lactamase class C family)